MRRENQSALALPGGDHYHREEEIDLGRRTSVRVARTGQ
jgi:hypothetical protein